MSRGRGPVAVAGVVVLAVVEASLVVVPLVRGLTTGTNLAGLVGVLLAVLTTAVVVWRWWRSAPVAADTEKLHKGADVLGQAVFAQWTEEARIRSLGDPDPMPVRWRLTSRAVMDHPELIAEGVLSFTGTADQAPGLAQQFRGLRRQRLVILGGPGSGKTTLAVQLVLELSNPKTRPSDKPVPVLLPVTGWDTKDHPRLQDWLAVRLAKDYPKLRDTALGPGTARSLVTHGHVLPVLDGLDELSDTARAPVIRAISTFLADGDGLILTSRTDEYADAVTTAEKPLRSAAVIEPDPLTPADTATYLKLCLPSDPGSKWEQILTTLKAGTAGPLTDTLATPLNVWLLRKTYIDNPRDPAPLREFPDPTAIRFHLLDELIPSVLASREPSTHAAGPFRARREWGHDQARRWLGYLAHLLTEHNTRDFAWWHLARHTIHPTRTKLAFGLTVGLAYGIAFGLAYGVAVGLVAWLVGAVVFGLLMDVRSWLYDEPGYADLRPHRPSTPASKTRTMLTPERPPGLAVRLMAGLAAGLVIGVVTGLAGWLAGGLAFGLLSGLAAGLPAGLVFGAVMWAGSPALTSKASTPDSSWRADRTLILVQVLTGGLAFGFAGRLADGFASGPVGGLMIGLVGGLPAGLVLGNHHAWLVYKVATVRLACTKQLPRPLMAFLHDAHRLGLLRAVGPVYQFRHADLHDHLAVTHISDQPPAPPPGSTGAAS